MIYNINVVAQLHFVWFWYMPLMIIFSEYISIFGYFRCDTLPFAKATHLVALLKTKLQFFCIYISGYVRPTGCLRCVCLISHHEKFGSTISLQTHHKSQSFESRTNTNGLCSTSTLTWVNINSKYFGCMLFCVYAIT